MGRWGARRQRGPEVALRSHLFRTRAGRERVQERTQTASLLRSEGEFSGKPRRELAQAGLCLGSAWLPKELS